MPRKIAVVNSIIPKSVSLAEAYRLGQPILQYAPLPKAARAYRDLAREVLTNK